MKFRTDFVTNSSSSCFCASLGLLFNNGAFLSTNDYECERNGEEDCGSCENRPTGKIRGDIDCTLLYRMAADRENIDELKKCLSSMRFTDKELKQLGGATALRAAWLCMTTCGGMIYVSSNDKELTEEAKVKIDEFWNSNRNIDGMTVDMIMNCDGKIDVDIDDGVRRSEAGYEGDEYDDGDERYEEDEYDEEDDEYEDADGYDEEDDEYADDDGYDEEDDECEDDDDYDEEDDGEYNPYVEHDFPTITLGTYPQTASGEDRTPIEWFVLKNEDGEALLISKYALDAKPYHQSNEDITWEKCSLRVWLNGEFFDGAFTEVERERILPVTVTADRNPDFETDPGNDTTDRVFLLSIREAEQYFEDDDARMCGITGFITENDDFFDSRFYDETEYDVVGSERNIDGRASCEWWLRSPGEDNASAAMVNGDVWSGGYSVVSTGICVRPCIRVRLS